MKKRKKYRKAGSLRQRPPKRHKKFSYINSALKNEVIRLLFLADSPMSIKEISPRLNYRRFSRKDLAQILSELLIENIARKNSKNSFSLSTRHSLVTGTVDAKPRGFGYLTDIADMALQPPYPRPTRDGFITSSRMGSARHGDRVLAQIIKLRRDGRPEIQIIGVLKRQSDRLAGYLEKDAAGFYLQPEDPRYPTVRIRKHENINKHIGDCVIVQLLRDNLDRQTLSGKIIEILGSPDNVDVQMRMVIERYGLPFIFSKEALHQSKSLSTLEKQGLDDSNRLDLRSIPFVTIDGESAKDFDDAVAVEKVKKGYRLYVAIADVSHFVRPGSQLDKEAYERGTSIYFPGRVIPMLPEALSNNLCSLLPHKDRLTFTAILEFDTKGKRLKKTFTRSIIRSRQRLTYRIVQKILVDDDNELRNTHKTLLPSLEPAAKLAILLKKRREKRGSIHFTIPEPEILLTEDGIIDSINRAQRFFAHELIEEFMLAANEAVAETFTQRRQQALYRIHEQPDNEKVAEFISFVSTIGLHLPAYDNNAEWYNQALDSVKDSPKEYIVNNLLLRTMQQARYDYVNVGHFGLAAVDYCHFTSPIRRYPDLVVHRDLFKLLTSSAEKTSSRKKNKNLETAIHLSARERTAVKAERDMNDRLKIQFMKKHIGKTFDGIISGVNNFAFFVELLDLFITGSVGLSELTDDYYFFEPDHHRLIGELSRKIFQIGDIIRVTVVSVDSQRGRINFIPEYLVL